MIDDKLLDAYVAELEALRVHGRNFALSYPDIASRLDISSRRSKDPQVERMVESAAFLAARLRLMIENNATELPQAMLSLIAPALVEPVPSMALIELVGGTEERFVPRGSRFDCMVGGGAPVCFSTTMPFTAAPITLRLRRLNPPGRNDDGIGVEVSGLPPQPLLLCLGNNERTAALLMDAFAETLSGIEVVPPNNGATISIPLRQLRIHGFAADEAALPVRPATHPAHRTATEFLVFPEKFRFVSLEGLALKSGSEVRFFFNRTLSLPEIMAPDLITVNRIPVINLWQSAATPIDIDGRRLEYPVRVDALRYRSVECHSVERVDLYQSGTAQRQRLDPVVSLGEVQGSTVRWGVRRSVSKSGGEALLYFEGLDYRILGRQRLLATASVLASNRDIAQHARTGASLNPLDGLGGWRGLLGTAPTNYKPALSGARAMETMIGYLQSHMAGLATEARRGLLSDYLKGFPGGDEAGWIDGIGNVAFRNVAELRQGQPQPGLAVVITFDTLSHPDTSQAIVKRVLGQLFEGQRGINRIQQVGLRGL